MSNKKAKEQLKALKEYRSMLFKEMKLRKLNADDFSNRSFQFLNQNKIRPCAKAHDKESILLNYYYWVIQLERRVATERKLIELGVGSIEQLLVLSEVYLKRRDQMVRRLVWELKIPMIDGYMVLNNLVEVVLEEEIVYTTRESLLKVKIPIFKFSKSKQPDYIPIITLY